MMSKLSTFSSIFIITILFIQLSTSLPSASSNPDHEVEEDGHVDVHMSTNSDNLDEDIEFLGRDETSESFIPEELDDDLRQAYEECQQNVLSKPVPDGDTLYCPANFDGWACWNNTPAGTIAYVQCPTVQIGFNPERLAHKECLNDGSWFRHPDTNKTWSNYTNCVDPDDFSHHRMINNLYICGYSISVIALLISLAIFFSFTSLKCDRITIHKNLFLSFIINNTLWIIWYIFVVYNPNVLVANEFPCQALHVSIQYVMLCNYFWMFCEGLYLHTLLVVAFVSEEKILKYFVLIGYGIPIPFIVAYSILRSTFPVTDNDNTLCWIDDSRYTYLLTGPVCVSMLLNLFFLINIVRVLVTKLRAVNSPDAHQTRKAVRATLILIPLLGLQYMLTPFRPPPGSSGEQFYDILSAIATSLQGLCVSLLFCFCNGEVINVIKKFAEDTCLNYPCLSIFLSSSSSPSSASATCYHSPLNNQTLASTYEHNHNSPKDVQIRDARGSNDSSSTTTSCCRKSSSASNANAAPSGNINSSQHRVSNNNHNNLNNHHQLEVINCSKISKRRDKNEEFLMLEERNKLVINDV